MKTNTRSTIIIGVNPERNAIAHTSYAETYLDMIRKGWSFFGTFAEDTIRSFIETPDKRPTSAVFVCVDDHDAAARIQEQCEEHNTPFLVWSHV